MPRTLSKTPTCTEARRAGIASFIGTTIRWYDFYIYGLAAAWCSARYSSPPTWIRAWPPLLSFVTLWSGFIARPLGGSSSAISATASAARPPW